MGIYIALALTAHTAQAQTPQPSAQADASRAGAPYLLPQTIFVGDPGRLVVPLGRAFTGVEPFILETFSIPDESPDLVIKRIELDRRGGSSRLLIDFIPYITGVLSFPPLDFNSLGLDLPEEASAGDGSQSGNSLPVLTGLELQVASILNPAQMALSDPASPLAAPGTSFLIYGFIVLVLVFLFLGIGLSLWGRRHFAELWDRLRRRRLIRLMAKFLRRLRQESSFEKEKKAGYYLTILAGELREFLSLFTGVNCYSLSAEEFKELYLGYKENPASPMPSPVFLCGLFRSWDNLRFSGRPVGMPDLFLALSQTESFIGALDKAEREKPLPETIRKSVSRQTLAGGEV